MRRSAGGLGAWPFLACLLLVWMHPASAADAPRIAVFDFELINTSPLPSTPDELARARRLGEQLRAALAQSAAYQPVDTAPVRDELERAGGSIRNCNGCERALAQKLGASEVAFGWVQKVSNLILNINLVIEDAASGKALRSGSVDIRGNTDESWSRGLKFLLEDRILNQ